MTVAEFLSYAQTGLRKVAEGHGSPGERVLWLRTGELAKIRGTHLVGRSDPSIFIHLPVYHLV